MESPDVNVLIYAFDESAPRHAEYLAWFDARVAKLSKKQADYLGVPADGPYKPEHYRY